MGLVSSDSDSCDHSFDEKVGEEYGSISDYVDTTEEYAIVFSKVFSVYECSNEGCEETTRKMKTDNDLTKIPLEEIPSREI